MNCGQTTVRFLIVHNTKERSTWVPSWGSNQPASVSLLKKAVWPSILPVTWSLCLSHESSSEQTFITDRTTPIKLGQTQKQNTPVERAIKDSAPSF